MEQIKGIVQPKMKITPSTYSCFVLADVYRGKYCDSQTSTTDEKNLNEFKFLTPKLFCGLKNFSHLLLRIDR